MQSAALLSHFIAHAPSVMAMFDRDMRYLATSLRWRQEYNLPEDPIGKSHYEVFPEIGERWKAFHRRGLAGETLRADFDEFARADGSTLRLRWEIQPWRLINREIGGIVIFTEDLTDRENEQEKTRKSEAVLRALGDNLPNRAVYRYARDPDGRERFLYISAGVEQLHGVTVEAALADPNVVLSQVEPDYLPKVAEALRISQRDLADFSLDVPIRHPNGETRWVSIRSRPFRQADGRVVWDGVRTDITEQMREEQSRRENEQSKQFLLNLADALKPLRAAEDIIMAASERLGRQLGVQQVVYAEIDSNEETATIRREWSEGSMPSSIGVHRLSNFGADLIANLRLGHVNAVEDVGADSRASSALAVATYREWQICAFLSVPLVKAGKLVVVLSAHHRRPHAWSAFDVSLVEETAARTWAAIERSHAEEALRESEERLRFAVAAASAGAWEWDPVTNKNIWSSEIWRLYGLEPESCEPGFAAWLSALHPDDRAAAALASTSAVAENRELEIEFRVRGPDGSDRWLLSRGAPSRRVGLAAPHYIGVVIDISERKRAEEKINYLAHHDALTGLPNRLAFNTRIAESVRASDMTTIPFAVLCMDLDRFKDVNDVFGHIVGDELLREMSARFQTAGRGAEIARIGGDEFMAIVRGDELRALAAETAERLRAAAASPFEIGGRQMRVNVSIGIALYPECGDTDALLANADAALYRAKLKGGGRVCFFDSSIDNRVRERHALHQSLESAIGRNELFLHYQPQADADGEILGFEALLRWRHPQRGLIPPNVFIPIAEESGLITEIGEWVLREACREAASWSRPLNIAVNLSPVQFLKDGLPATVQSVLDEMGLPGRRLELEITEGVFVHDFAHVTAILHQLKSLGVKVAMDDFGTGYSSLSYLQTFPFDKIKIDRSFVSSLHNNPSAEAIVRAIVGLGRGLGVPLIAEGVETQEQLDFLRAVGCNEAQGYLIGMPRPMAVYAPLVGGRTERHSCEASV